MQPSTSNAGAQQQQRHSMHQMSGQFPSGSLESTAPKSAMSRKRPRIFARDFAWAPQRRLMMSLRSGQVLETTWALNALTAMLYDDTQQPLRLDHTDPQLLSLLVEHLRATLAILYPQVDFNISETDNMLDAVYEDDESTTKDHGVEEKKLTNLAEEISEYDREQGASTTNKTSILSPTHNYTLKTRTDRQVKVESVAKPEKLRRMCIESSDDKNRSNKQEGEFDWHYNLTLDSTLLNQKTSDLSSSSLQKQIEFGRGSSFANRMYRNLRARLTSRRALSKPTYSLADRLSRGSRTENKEVTSVDDGYNSDRENEKEVCHSIPFQTAEHSNFLFRINLTSFIVEIIHTKCGTVLLNLTVHYYLDLHP